MVVEWLQNPDHFLPGCWDHLAQSGLTPSGLRAYLRRAESQGLSINCQQQKALDPLQTIPAFKCGCERPTSQRTWGAREARKCMCSLYPRTLSCTYND